MSQPVITVEGLGKRYLIGHQVRHDTLRDRIAYGARGLLRRWKHPVGGTTTQEEFWALRDVSFEIKQGEVVGIIGRNGAGKSTLLKILSRITEPTTGRAAIRGRVASLLEVGTGFHPELTGRENIFLNGAILGMSRAEIRAKFDEIVAFAEVDRFLDTPVKHYSSGMYVRLAFAVAAHLEPEILIVDEVLAVGDAQFQTKCIGKMESIARTESRTVLFVSHNISAIARLCTSTVLLESGKVAFDGATPQAIGQYLSARNVATQPTVDLTTEGYIRDAPVKILTIAFNAGGSICNREPLRVELRVEAGQAGPVGFGIGFSNIEGRRVVTIESDYHDRLFELNRPAEYTITLQIPVLDLVPGRYRIDVGAFGPQHRNYHYFPDCCTINVLPGSHTPAHLHGVHGDWRPAYNWRLE